MTGIPISIRRVRERERDREREREYRNTPKSRGLVILSHCLSSSGGGWGKRSDSISVQLSNRPTGIDLSINNRLFCQSCRCTIWKAFWTGVQQRALALCFLRRDCLEWRKLASSPPVIHSLSATILNRETKVKRWRGFYGQRVMVKVVVNTEVGSRKVFWQPLFYNTALTEIQRIK